MIKVNNKMLREFLDIMDFQGDPVFGSPEEIKKQLELCLNTQGFWSGIYTRIFYDKESKKFIIKAKRELFY